MKTGTRIYRTRFPELGYTRCAPREWRFVDLTDPDRGPVEVGSIYPSRAELLANVERYASEFGCEGARPRPEKTLPCGCELLFTDVQGRPTWKVCRGHMPPLLRMLGMEPAPPPPA